MPTAVVERFLSCITTAICGIVVPDSSLTAAMTLESRKVVHIGNPEFGEKYLNYHRYRLKICVCSLTCTAAIGLVAASIVFQIINFSDIFPQKYELGEGDMRAVSVSTMFCEGITLKDDMTSRRLRVLSKLRLSVQTKRSNVSTQVYVVKNHYWYKTFYLLEGSSLLINAKSDSYFKLIILRGRERLNEWMKTQVELTHEEEANKKTQRGAINTNHGKTTRISYELFVQGSDNYYVLFRHISGGKSLSLLHISLSVNRVLYDVGPTLFTCVAQPGQTCDAGLLFGSHESVVIEIMASSSHISAINVNTRWRCDTRVWFYIAIFGGCFFATSLVAIFIYVVCAMARRRKLKAKLSKYYKGRSVNEMLVPPAPKFTRPPSIRSHGSLRRYPPTRTYSQTSQTSQATNSSFKRESRPLLSVPMYDGIPDSDKAEITYNQDREESDNAGEISNVLNEYRLNKRIGSRDDNDNMSFESFSSFDTGTSSQKLSFTTFCQRFPSNESESEDGENLSQRIPADSQGYSAAISRCTHTRPRAKSCTTQSPDRRYRHSCAKRSKSFPRFKNDSLGGNYEENLSDHSSLQQQFSFPVTVHSPPVQKARENGKLPHMCCHSDNTVKQTRSSPTQKRHPIKFQAVSEVIDCDVSGDIHQPSEDIWVAKCTKPVEEISVKLQEKSTEKKNAMTLPNGIVKKRDKKRSPHGWKPRLSVVSESEV